MGSIHEHGQSDQQQQPEAFTENENGEARRDKTEIPVHADGSQLEEVRRSSSAHGGESFRATGTNDPQTDSQYGENFIRKVLGKILGRVDELERKYLEYVDSHQQRLAQRLSESEASKQEALQLVAEIREMASLIDQAIEKDIE